MTYSTDQQYHFQFQSLDLREKRGIRRGIWIPFARSSQFFIEADKMMQFKIRILKENGLHSMKKISLSWTKVHLLIICVWLQLNVLYRLECPRASLSYYYWQNRLYNPQTFFSVLDTRMDFNVTNSGKTDAVSTIA